MARSVEEIARAGLQLLPPGAVWPTSIDSEFANLLWAFAQELHELEQRDDQLLLEMSPATAQQLFDEWEKDLALPNPCIVEAQTESERRAALVTKHHLVGGQSKQFFIDIAASLGYTITIDEYDEANPGPQTHYQGMPITGASWNYVWQINSDVGGGEPLYVGGLVGSRLTTWEAQLLECTISNLVHDHRILFFNLM